MKYCIGYVKIRSRKVCQPLRCLADLCIVCWSYSVAGKQYKQIFSPEPSKYRLDPHTKSLSHLCAKIKREKLTKMDNLHNIQTLRSDILYKII